MSGCRAARPLEAMRNGALAAERPAGEQANAQISREIVLACRLLKAALMKISFRFAALASASALTLAGATACDKTGGETSTTTTSSAADNTGVNARDKDASAVTPMSQGNDVADIQTTANLRKALMADSTLSTNAKNVKVVTAGGTLTLRGPVDSAAEKQNIDAKAHSVAGGNAVVDELEITTK